MNIYDYIGERFFAPLTRKNKYIYMDSILFLNDLLSELDLNQENFKQTAIEALARKLESINDKLYNDDLLEDNQLEAIEIDNAMKSQYIINKLIDFGWLFEEEVGNGRRSLNFYDYSLAFIKTIKDIQKNTKRQYTGYIRTIRQSINSFDYSKLDDLEIIDSSLENLVLDLRSLYSNLNIYYRNIIKNKDNVELKELLNEFTSNYKNDFFDSSYYNLKVNDRVDNEIPKIIDELDDIFADFFKMQKLVDARVNKEFNIAEASIYIDDVVQRIKDNIRRVPSLIRNIDSKNEKYVNRTVSVILHKIKRGDDLEGVLNQLIEYVKEDKLENDFLGVFKMKHYTFEAMAKPKAKAIRVEPKMLELNNKISEEALERAREILIEEKKYNIDNVNKYVDDFLEGYEMRRISEADYTNKYDFLMIVSIMMYSAMPKANYDLHMTDERIDSSGVSFNDFYVMRRGAK